MSVYIYKYNIINIYLYHPLTINHQCFDPSPLAQNWLRSSKPLGHSAQTCTEQENLPSLSASHHTDGWPNKERSMFDGFVSLLVSICCFFNGLDLICEFNNVQPDLVPFHPTSRSCMSSRPCENNQILFDNSFAQHLRFTSSMWRPSTVQESQVG